MTTMYYDSLRQAIEAKKCHFCQKQMVPYNRTFSNSFKIENGFVVVEDRVFPIDKEADTGYINSLDFYDESATHILMFQCPIHLYRSDITIEYSEITNVFIPRLSEEEVLMFDSERAYYVRNLFDIGLTKIHVMDKNLINPSMSSIDISIMENFDDSPSQYIELMNLPSKIESLLLKIKIYLTFS